MIEEKEITSKDKDYNDWIEILIRKYENTTSHLRNESITFLGFFVTFSIALIVASLGWNVESFKNISVSFWKGNSIVKLIIVSVIFTLLYFTFRVTVWIMKLKPIQKFILRIFKVNEFLSEEKKLNSLYLSKLRPKNWSIKVKIDEDNGILELSDIKKRKHLT